MSSTLRNELQKELIRRNKEILIKEAIIAIVAEQAVEQQLQQAQPVAPQNPPVSAPVAPEQQLTVDAIIEKINVIRGGTSFSDPEVYGQLTSYWNSLPENQKTNLDSQLNNIGKIVSFAEPKEAQQNTSVSQATQAPPSAPSALTPGTAPQNGGQAPISPSQPSF